MTVRKPARRGIHPLAPLFGADLPASGENHIPGNSRLSNLILSDPGRDALGAIGQGGEWRLNALGFFVSASSNSLRAKVMVRREAKHSVSQVRSRIFSPPHPALHATLSPQAGRGHVFVHDRKMMAVLRATLSPQAGRGAGGEGVLNNVPRVRHRNCELWC